MNLIDRTLPVFIAAAAGGAVAFGLLVYLMQRVNRNMLERLQASVMAANPDKTVDVISEAGGLLGVLVRFARILRGIRPMGELMARATPPSRHHALNERIESAGMREYLTPQDVSEAQIVGALGGFVIMFLLGGGFSPKAFALALVTGAVTYRLSLVPITNNIQHRQGRIRGSLPKCADILVVAVEAGMTFDRAIALYAERFGGPLTEELRRIQEDIKVGHRRRDAFQAAMDRVNLDDLSRFLSAILLAERFGVPVAMVLRDQSEALKLRRTQRIREASMKAPIKMLIPTVSLILPALLIVLLGPMIVIVATGGLF